MTDRTRYVRVNKSVEALRNDDRTRIPNLRLLPKHTLEEEFARAHRAMAAALGEEPRPGLFVFAHHDRYGSIGRLWLQATEAPRAGTLGRHDLVDLALPLDDTLSLRHALFIVRLAGTAVRTTVVDLASSAGIELDSGQSVRRCDVDGPFALRLRDFLLFCVPTGAPPPWSLETNDPWETLARTPPRHVQPRVASDTASRLERKARGHFHVQQGDHHAALPLSNRELERGVLIGRAERCDVQFPVDTVSRVHAVLLSLDDSVFLVDAGSTNGLWLADGSEVTCHRFHRDELVWLWDLASLAWLPA